MRKHLLSGLLLLVLLLSACRTTQDPAKTAVQSPPAAAPQTPPAFALTGQIERQDIFAQDGVTVTALSLEVKPHTGSDGTQRSVLALNVHVENSSDKELLLKPFEFTVNGITTYGYDAAGYAGPGYADDGYFVLGYVDNPPDWYKFHTLAALGITDVAEVRFEMVFIEAESGATYAHAPVRLVTGLAFAGTTPVENGNEKTVYDENGLRIGCLGLTDDVAYPDQKAGRIRLHLENDTDEILAVTIFGANGYAADVTVNGADYCLEQGSLTTFPSPLYEVLPGASLYTDIYIDKADFAQFGLASVADIKSFSCRFQVSAADFHYNDTVLFTTPAVTFTF